MTANMSSTYDRPVSKILNSALLVGQQSVSELWMVHHAEPSDIHIAHEDGFHEHNLSEKGLSQAFFLSKKLQDYKVSAIYSCPCGSCLQTAEIIAVPHDLVVTTMMDLSGIRFFANKPQDTMVPALREALAGYQDEIERAFTNTGKWTAFPFCEVSKEFRQRISQAIDEVLDYHIGERIVLVADSTVINGYIAEILDITKDMWFHPDYGSVSVVRSWNYMRVVHTINDTAHLGSGCNNSTNTKVDKESR